MARPAMVMGIETEYGIYLRGEHPGKYDNDLTSANEAVRNAIRTNIEIMGKQIEITMGGGLPEYQHLANGARSYTDCNHPEMSIAECQTPRDAVLWDAAGERIVYDGARKASEKLGFGVSIVKNLVDASGHTWGCHENYCIEPRLFTRITKEEKRLPEQNILATWLTVRQLLTGGGKVGFDNGAPRSAFQISQRADFIEQFRNDQTMNNRPIIQGRDQPLADLEQWRRLHIICGDANLCQWSTYFKMGLTGLLLLMLQDQNLERRPPLPIIWDEAFHNVMRFISHDSDLVAHYPVRVMTGRREMGGKRHMTAAEILTFYVDACVDYAHTRPWSSPREAASYQEVAKKAQWATRLLGSRDWPALYGWLDWPTKRVVVQEYLRRHNKKFEDVLQDSELMSRLKLLANHCYAALDPAVSMYARLMKAGAIRSVVKGSEVGRAFMHPPMGRAAQRAALVERYAPYLKRADWNILEFHQTPFTVTVMMNDPMGYPDEQFAVALQECSTPVDLLFFLSKNPIQDLLVSTRRESNAG